MTFSDTQNPGMPWQRWQGLPKAEARGPIALLRDGVDPLVINGTLVATGDAITIGAVLSSTDPDRPDVWAWLDEALKGAAVLGVQVAGHDLMQGYVISEWRRENHDWRGCRLAVRLRRVRLAADAKPPTP